MKGVVDDLIDRVRDLSMNLRPAMLDTLGLLSALTWQIERFEAQTGISVRFHHADLDRRFGPQLEITAFRIVQEALTNVARHAGVKQANVDVWANSTSLGVLDILRATPSFTRRLYGSEESIGAQERSEVQQGSKQERQECHAPSQAGHPPAWQGGTRRQGEEPQAGDRDRTLGGTKEGSEGPGRSEEQVVGSAQELRRQEQALEVVSEGPSAS